MHHRCEVFMGMNSSKLRFSMLASIIMFLKMNHLKPKGAIVIAIGTLSAMAALLISCGSNSTPNYYPTYNYPTYQQPSSPSFSSYPSYSSDPISYSQPGLNGASSGSSSSSPRLSSSQLLKQINLKRDYIPYGRHARKYKRRMNPRYITIHSTQNYSPSANAWQHSKALRNGKLRASKRPGGNRIGYLSWHYSIDQSVVVQHLPDNEQGEHADFNGPGNNYSLGLEMCENRGNSRSRTVDRTAKLAAYLMKKHNIPLKNVVPHYHWPRRGLSKLHKNCPHFLLDNGRPGAKWRGFQAKVKMYHDQISGRGGSANYYASQYSRY